MKKLFWVKFLILLFVLSSCVSNSNNDEVATEYFNVGNAFYSLEEMDKAKEYYLKVLSIDENFHKARFNLIHVLVAQEEFELANKHIDFLIIMNEDNLEIKKLVAYIRYSEGELEESLGYYMEIYKSGDESSEILLNIVKINYQLEKYSLALEFIDKLLLVDNTKELYLLAGIIAEANSEDYQAIEFYENAITLGSKDIDLLDKLSKIYEELFLLEDLKVVLELIVENGDDELKSAAFFRLATLLLLEDNDYSGGYSYLIDAIGVGFKDKEKALELLEEPNLIEADKIRALFVESEIIE